MDLDFSLLNLSNHPDKITPAEVRSVVNNPRSRTRNIDGYPPKHCYTIEAGYSNKKRIVMVASRMIEVKRQILQVKIADEDEIAEYYCD